MRSIAQLIILVGAVGIVMTVIEHVEQAFGIWKNSGTSVLVAALAAIVLVRIWERNFNWKRILS
jgi:hypothetical protein